MTTLVQRFSCALLTLLAYSGLLTNAANAQLLSIEQAVKASEETGRPILAVAGGES